MYLFKLLIIYLFPLKKRLFKIKKAENICSVSASTHAENFFSLWKKFVGRKWQKWRSKTKKISLRLFAPFANCSTSWCVEAQKRMVWSPKSLAKGNKTNPGPISQSNLIILLRSSTNPTWLPCVSQKEQSQKEICEFKRFFIILVQMLDNWCQG